MNKIIKYIPGFRSQKTWKMVIASLFYILSFFTLFLGYQYFFFFLSVIVTLGYSSEMLIESLSGNSVKEIRLRFFASQVVLFLSIVVFISSC